MLPRVVTDLNSVDSNFLVVFPNKTVCFAFDMSNGTELVFNFCHNDFKERLDFSNFMSFISSFDKKLVIDTDAFDVESGCDLNVLLWMVTLGKKKVVDRLENKKISTFNRWFEGEKTNRYIPSSFMFSSYRNMMSLIREVDLNGRWDVLSKYSLIYQYMKKMSLERLHLGDGNTLCSDYFFTRSGRIYNKNSYTINNNKDKIISRFGDGGLLVEFDYKSASPNMAAMLVGEELSDNFYDECREHVEWDDISYKELKQRVLASIYKEKTPESFLDISFFEKLDNLKKNLFGEINNNGYIETPIFGRRIIKDSMGDDYKNKLMAYLMQSLETEYNFHVLRQILDYLYSDDIESRMVLYEYDSFLFDFKLDEVEVLNFVKGVFNDSGISCNISRGKRYNKMEKLK